MGLMGLMGLMGGYSWKPSGKHLVSARCRFNRKAAGKRREKLARLARRLNRE